MTDRYAYSTALGRDIGQQVEELLADEVQRLSSGVCTINHDPAETAVDYAKRTGEIKAYREVLKLIQEAEKKYHEQRFTDRNPGTASTAG